MARLTSPTRWVAVRTEAGMGRSDPGSLHKGHHAHAPRSTEQRHAWLGRGGGTKGTSRLQAQLKLNSETESQGRLLAVGLISVCAMLVSLVAVVLCVRLRKRPRRAPRPGDYDDAMSVINDIDAPHPRPRLDTAGYTEVNIGPDTKVTSPGPQQSEYHRLGAGNQARAMSVPTCPRKAYDHVTLSPRSKSTGAKSMTNGRAKRVDNYDVTMTREAHVKVIDGIYHKLTTGRK